MRLQILAAFFALTAGSVLAVRPASADPDASETDQATPDYRHPTARLPTSVGELDESREPGALPSGRGEDVGVPIGSGTFVGLPPSGVTTEQAAEWTRQAAEPGSNALTLSRQYTVDARNAMAAQQYETVYQRATEAVKKNPQNVQALNYRAIALIQMRRYSEAMQDADSALGIASDNPGVLGTRALLFSKLGKYGDGLSDAETALRLDPSNATLYQDKAFALAGLGDRAGALAALRRSAELDARFRTRLDRAADLPQDGSLLPAFDDGPSASAAAPPPRSSSRRLLRMTLLTGVGGLLIALCVLHIVSARWREKMRLTVRRALGASPPAAAERAPTASPSQGSFWTQYHLVKEIGLGGMGVVYEALDRSLERRVAVKKMRDEIRLDPQDRRRFINEARLVAQLHHPAIVDIYGIVEDGADVYLVFEYVEGRTLQDVLKSDGAMDLPGARGVLKEMGAAIEHAHGRGIVHRDLKPSNVMITPKRRVKVMDFGVARQAKDALTRHSLTNTVVGTPPYMAPEQEQGTVRKESDVYALGVCLYEMTTGFLPFTGSGAAMLLNKLNGKLIPATQRVPSLPTGFDAVIAKALAPDPDRRYRTPAELVAALDVLLAPAA